MPEDASGNWTTVHLTQDALHQCDSVFLYSKLSDLYCGRGIEGAN